MESVLVIASHPDDEILGVGGTIAKHVSNGDSVASIIVAEGATSRAAGDAKGDVEVLCQNAIAAAETLGAHPPIFLGLADNRLDAMPRLDIIKLLEREIARLSPTVVYTHHGGDLNIDHQIVHEAVLTACRPIPSSSVKSLYGFETLSSTEWGANPYRNGFVPTRFVDISSSMTLKLKALECYRDAEMRAFPHARSFEAVQALATLRGAQAGVEAAEAFITIREHA